MKHFVTLWVREQSSWEETQKPNTKMRHHQMVPRQKFEQRVLWVPSRERWICWDVVQKRVLDKEHTVLARGYARGAQEACNKYIAACLRHQNMYLETLTQREEISALWAPGVGSSWRWRWWLSSKISPLWARKGATYEPGTLRGGLHACRTNSDA